jgi:Tol biopolymer transport system component
MRATTLRLQVALQIFHVPLPNGEPRRITNDLNNYWKIDLSADGRTLMALQMQLTSGCNA